MSRRRQRQTAIVPEATTAVGCSPAATYSTRQGQFAELRDGYNARRYLAANVSVVLFFGALALLIAALVSASLLLGALAAAAAVGFVAAFRRQGLLDEAHQRYDTLTLLQGEGLARLRRDWDTIPLPGLA